MSSSSQISSLLHDQPNPPCYCGLQCKEWTATKETIKGKKFFESCVWAIWHARNAVIFAGSHFYFDAVWEMVHQSINEWDGASAVKYRAVVWEKEWEGFRNLTSFKLA
ncbi:hypothetical protein QJS10_CPB20g00439 [Acorus calamus]|uniref:Uncharacterized protein n=1 Tax=Acorus calamus TaxID=4465 RepID=A0AAV9C9Y1_ACOCL|nr:hypothetical protein QJS10_CPB20g00439 [Acorus calamus]